jgi:hypothetical protein
MLIDQYQIAVRIGNHATGGTLRILIGLARKWNTSILQLLLNFADVHEWIRLIALLVPPRIERQDVLFEHALKKPDYMIFISENQPILVGVSAHRFETEFGVKIS